MMGSAERERLDLLKTVAQSRKEIQVSYTLFQHLVLLLGQNNICISIRAVKWIYCN